MSIQLFGKHWQHTTVQAVVRATAGLALILGLATNAASAADKAPAEPSRPSESQRVKPGEVPQGLDPQSWDSIQAQIDAARYDFSAEGEGISGANPEQRWELKFDSSGLSVGRFKPVLSLVEGPKAEPTSDSPPAHVGSAREQHAGLTRPTGDALRLRTTAIGRAEAMQAADPAAPAARDNRIELHHSQATEWYINTAAGLEHGYTFEQAPQGARGEVRIQLAVDGGFKAESGPDGVHFTDAAGQRMRYHKLLVVDAAGHRLDAQLRVAAEDQLLIAFDDRDARYPVLVDPLLVNEEQKLTVGGDGGFNDFFGWSVAVDGDTLVVGRQERASVNFTQNQQQGAAYVYVRSGSTWTRQAKLVGSDSAATDLFGSSVAISGNTVAVGASSGPNAGDVYTFTRSGQTWTQQAKLPGHGGGNLGGEENTDSIALSGDTLIVGESFAAASAGEAYVYVRSGSTWSEQARLTASDPQGVARFGVAVTVNGDTAIVGAHFQDVGANIDQGAAYVFVRSGSTWTQQARLVASDGTANDFFGNGVVLSGNTAMIGAIQAPGGAVYVYTRTGSVWTEQQKLTAPFGVSNRFGLSIGLDGARAVIGGLHQFDTTPPPPFGNGGEIHAAFAFARDGSGVWVFQNFLFGPAYQGPNFGDFGYDLALSGSTAVVGFATDDTPQQNEGAAYVYVNEGSNWPGQARIIERDGAGGDQVGYAVAIDADWLVIGAPFDDLTGLDTGANGQDQGSAYIFQRSGTAWTLHTRFRLSGLRALSPDVLGLAVAMDGDTIVIGAPGIPPASVINQPLSRVYVLVRSGNVWTEQAELVASDGAGGDRFGFSVALSGDTLVVGADHDRDDASNNTGSAYIFVRSGTTWTQQAKLAASAPGDAADGDRFGTAVAVDGNTALIGALGDDQPPHLDTGAAYVFVRSGTSWTQQTKLTVPISERRFGSSLSLSSETALIGATGVLPGAAFVFVRTGSAWTQQARLSAGADSFFGTAVALSGDIALIGAPNEVPIPNPNNGGFQGAAYVFVRSGITWSQQNRLTVSDLPTVSNAGDNFGFAVALSGDSLLIGAPLDDNRSGGDAGSAYVYRVGLDFGDAPAPYPSLLANNGARHLLSGPKLGSLIDAESDGQPNSGATGDDIAGIDDEDGVSFGTLTAGSSSTVSVFTTAPSGAGLLDGWIDFNRDNDWADAGEQIFNDFIVMNGANNGLSFAVPGTAVAGISHARLRLSSEGVAAPTGQAPDGEVEDYIVTLTAPSTGSVRLSSATYSVNEAGPTAVITLTRTGGSSGAASVRIATSNGSATAGSDYTAVNQVVNWANGDSVNKTVSIAISNDGTDEPNETVNLTLSNATGASLGTPSSGVLTIVDNDDPPVTRTLSINDVPATEGNSGTRNFTFTVSLSAAASGPVSVGYATANGTATVAGNDYNAGSGTVSFAVGDTAKTFSVVVRGDTTVEPDETFVVNLSGPVGATIADGSGAGTITNDDAAAGLPAIRINDVSVSEGASGRTKAAKFTVILSRSSTQTVTVRYATANGTAVAPGDYTAKSGTLSFAPGTTSKTVNVTVKGDSTREPNETFRVNLSSPVRATVSDSQGIGTIRNDD